MRFFLIFLAVLLPVAVFTQTDAGLVDEKIRAGMRQFDLGYYEDALSEFEGILKIDSLEPTALSMAVVCNYQLQNYSKAIEKAVKIETSLPPETDGMGTIYLYHAKSLELTRQPEEAVKIYRIGISQFPDDANLEFNLGFTLLNQEAYKEADIAFCNAIRKNRDLNSAYYFLGSLHFRQGHSARAFLWMTFSLMKAPNGKRSKLSSQILQAILEGKSSAGVSEEPSKALTDLEKQIRENEIKVGEDTRLAHLKILESMNFSSDSDSGQDILLEKMDILKTLRKKKMLEAFSHFIFQSSNPESAKWLKDHPSENAMLQIEIARF